ncbi:VIT1/CCC1 transporter family protein [candidate division WOR-3 bacterium]|nr:VIT1/CCC1 transporter family protein [candidate division WOR-3 bacterium]
MPISEKTIKILLKYQKNEITEHNIYLKLAKREKSPENRKVFEEISADELRHYNQWREYTKKDVSPDRRRIFFFFVISRLFGLTFGVKLMERGEESAQTKYKKLIDEIPGAGIIAEEEDRHENALLQLLDEERLRYTGSMVLGLNDALVELTGALAGFTFALRNTKLVALTGAITGFAAALSMAASEYLSKKSDETDKNPFKASLYTGSAYIITVVLLIAPFLLLNNIFICLATTLITAIAIIAVFNYYISVAKDQKFKNRFIEMAGLSVGVAVVSFFIGYLLRAFIGVDP